MKIEIRPLKEDDATVSWRWRNDPVVWELTGSRPDRYITPDMEREWILSVLARENERRFAICVSPDGKYIGNVQLTDITESNAQVHIFIGEQMFWGKGIATDATNLILQYAFNVLKLKQVYLIVKKVHLASRKACEKCGFHRESETDAELKMIITDVEYGDNSNQRKDMTKDGTNRVF